MAIAGLGASFTSRDLGIAANLQRSGTTFLIEHADYSNIGRRRGTHVFHDQAC